MQRANSEHIYRANSKKQLLIKNNIYFKKIIFFPFKLAHDSLNNGYRSKIARSSIAGFGTPVLSELTHNSYAIGTVCLFLTVAQQCARERDARRTTFPFVTDTRHSAGKLTSNNTVLYLTKMKRKVRRLRYHQVRLHHSPRDQLARYLAASVATQHNSIYRPTHVNKSVRNP